MARLPVVAVINTNPDLVELLKVRIEAAGFVVLVIHIADIRSGLDLGAVLAQHQPQVVVYDVVAPFERSWRFLQHLRETAMKHFHFVLTTPNAGALSRLVGRDEKNLRGAGRPRRHRRDRPGGERGRAGAADELMRGAPTRRGAGGDPSSPLRTACRWRGPAPA